MRRTLIIVGAWMAAVWLIAGLATLTPIVPGSPVRSANPLDRWDAPFYQSHAEGTDIERKAVVTPLYSWLVASLMIIPGFTFGLASGLMSVFLTATAVVLLWKVLSLTAADRRETTIFLLIASPVSFSLLAPYPVSLLLLLSVLTWWALVRGKPVLGFLVALLAPLAHPTGLAFTIVALGLIVWSRSIRTIAVALALSGLALVSVISSGALEKFLDARIGYSTFEGISFWTAGAWWLTHHATPAIGWLMLATLAYSAVGIALVIIHFWRQSAWPTWSALGLLGTGILSGLWIGIPRYVLPSPAGPLAIAGQAAWLRRTMIVFGFTLQALWIWGFVSWNAFI